MAIYNVHAGHNPEGKIACGAVGILNESREARLIKNAVITELKQLGHTVYDCTVEDGTSQNDVLNKIVSKCNAHNVDLDISIHLNSGRNDYSGDGRNGGTEVWVYPNGGADTFANNICKEIAALGFSNRGVKTSSGLYVLSKTKAKALLIECCFVDDRDDANIYNANKMAKAIVKGITGTNYVENPTPNPTPTPAPAPTPAPTPTKADVKYQVKAGGKHYSEITNYNTSNGNGYAGVENVGITDVAMRVTKGTLQYRVHVKGGNWLGWVSGYNWSDANNGYAGNGKQIDGIQMKTSGTGGKIKYRVSYVGSTGYLPWVTEANDYAGVYGKSIDKIQAYIG